MEPHTKTSETSFWQLLRQKWCRHERTIVTPKTATMPAHAVCETCGWREPVIASTPKAIRTWDSTRDEARYEREKKRRVTADHQRQVALAQRATPAAVMQRARRRRSNVLEMKRVVGE